MTKKKSRDSKHSAQEQGKKQQLLMIAGFAGLFLVLFAAFFSLREDQGAGNSGPQEFAEAPEIGALAPNFQLTTNNGEQLTLSDFRGRPVAVTFMHTW